MFLGHPFRGCLLENAHGNGGGKKSREKRRKMLCNENEETGPGTCFPLKEKNFRLPSSAEVCRFDIGSSTLCVPSRHGGGFL